MLVFKLVFGPHPGPTIQLQQRHPIPGTTAKIQDCSGDSGRVGAYAHTHTNLIVVTPRACARDKAIGFVCLSSVVIIKIARSPHLGIWATRKYKKSVEVSEKLASLCFESIDKAHESH